MGQLALVEIQPEELKFIFELKKQCSCSIQLLNKTEECIAFKIKTTSPKKYCVRPNTGIIQPSSTCDITVTMQAQKESPPDLQLKDKFLVQSTIVPFGTTDEDIVPNFFFKETGRYIQENKMRVVLVSPPDSPRVESINGGMKLDSFYASAVPEKTYGDSGLNENPVANNGALKEEPTQILSQKTTVNSNNASARLEPVYEVPIVKRTSSEVMKQEPEFESPISKETSISIDQTKAIRVPSHDVKALDDLKLKIESLEEKLNAAEKTIVSQREQNNQLTQEKDKLQQDFASLRRASASRVRTGFPFLFVVFVALVSMAFGRLLLM